MCCKDNERTKKHKDRGGKDIPCEVCGKIIYITPTRLQKNKHHTCSKKCMSVIASKERNHKVMRPCVVCNKEVWYKKSHAKKVNNSTCSIECAALFKKSSYKGENNPKYRNRSKEDQIFNERAVSCNRRAKILGVVGNLTGQDIKELWESQNGKCFYTDTKMDLKSEGRGGLCASSTVFSVDRVTPIDGYTRSNIVLCCNSVNRLRGDTSQSEFLMLLNNIVQNLSYKVPAKVVKVSTSAEIPSQAHAMDVGYDIKATEVKDLEYYVEIETHIKISPSKGYWFMVAPRSSISNLGLSMCNSIAVIDPGFTGMLKLRFYKQKNYTLPSIGDKIGQIILMKRAEIAWEEVDELSDTARGSGGFGSTGV